MKERIGLWREGRCTRCEGRAVLQFISLDVRWRDGSPVHLDGVPAYKCEACGHVFLELNAGADFMSAVERFVAGVKRPGQPLAVKVEWKLAEATTAPGVRAEVTAREAELHLATV